MSRLIWRSWSRRLATGIDRVCYAYLENFRERSQALVQYRGIPRILSVKHSERLFDMLLDDDENFKARLLALAPAALAAGKTRFDCGGAFYLNVGHTDVDLDRLVRWVGENRLRAIYLIHDLIPLTHSEFCNPSSVDRHRGRVTNAIAHAAGIITNSEASTQELQRFAELEGLRTPPVIAAWLAGAQFARPQAIPFKAPQHFVCVGTIEARKNHYLLLQIWRRLAERLGEATPKLVIIGQKGAQASHVEGMLERCHIIGDHVVTLSHCGDEELGRWMATARALLMPSFAEGFGLPLVEALQVGTPVIASDLPCFREIGEGIPTLLDPLDAVSWERTILSFLENGPDRSRQLRLLRDYQAPSWKNHFDGVESWLKTLPHHEAHHLEPVSRGARSSGGNSKASLEGRAVAIDGADF
ncbi:glycosyltransferase family 4 protein [Sphingomonas lycopersici]|uniref:Glycosyltransferase family 4 protein n=1 Tax=Sphingomonas lycopersici TaxID=2951807 RepID=A0AA42CU71_9SPHN|nr:glycosyltransferase family 4 protein [Sphingomonas lycopersici]